jgi:DNA processing protein
MSTSAADIFDLLRLTLTPGLGPVLIDRCLTMFGSAGGVLRASPRDLERVKGIGPSKAGSIAAGLAASAPHAQAELELASSLGIRIFARGGEEYPALLAEVPSAPPILYVKGDLRPSDADRYTLAVVGSRDCTQYGLEQARRFAGAVAGSGVTIVSGGARGIDAAAHLAALIAGGRTIAVLGSGLANPYPPEHTDLFDRIARSGALVSELPLRTPPAAENFPARNRIISGLSLGVLVVEAGVRSGALITARTATEDHGREVFAIPGRVDSLASRGTLELLREGGAALALDPADVLNALESAAHHQHRGTHAERFRPVPNTPAAPGVLFDHPAAPAPNQSQPPMGPPEHAAILNALDEPRTLEQLLDHTGLGVADLRVAITMLEIQGRITRAGSRLVRA